MTAYKSKLCDDYQKYHVHLYTFLHYFSILDGILVIAYLPQSCDDTKAPSLLVYFNYFINLDGIPVTVYKPKSCDDIKAPSVLVYFHGGGHVVGCRKTSEPVCKILAR